MASVGEGASHGMVVKQIEDAAGFDVGRGDCAQRGKSGSQQITP